MKPIYEHSEVKICTIAEVNYSGKWIEFIFKKASNNRIFGGMPYDFSCKCGHLEEALDQAGLQTDVANHGLIGLRLVLIWINPNWHIFCFAAGRDVESED